MHASCINSANGDRNWRRGDIETGKIVIVEVDLVRRYSPPFRIDFIPVEFTREVEGLLCVPKVNDICGSASP